MQKKNPIVIILLVLAIALLAFIIFKPKYNISNINSYPMGQTMTLNNPTGSDYQPNPKPTFSTALPTPYIRAQSGWPPVIQNSAIAYSCNPPSHTNGMDKSSIEKMINGRTYCVLTISEGAAGTMYKTYTYTTASGGGTNTTGGTKTATFTLGFTDCGVYGSVSDPQSKAGQCQTAQSNFTANLDTLIDSLM